MIAMILGLIALGLVVVSAIALTTRWIVNKIKEKKCLGYVKKVILSDIKGLAYSCDNTITLEQLDELSNQGITHIMADIDASGNIVGELEAIRDTNQQLDDEVEKLLGKKGMVMVEVN